MKINKFLNNQDIRFNVSSHLLHQLRRNKIQPPNIKRNKLYRIFNESWDKGGRFYGHWAQGLPSKFRQHITINSQQVTELDYSSIHPYILYGKKGLPMPTEDVYALDGMSTNIDGSANTRQRKICKKVLLTIFNVNPTQDPVKAVIMDLRDNGIYAQANEVQHIIDQLKNKHHPIKEFFASGVGPELQRIDSDIAERILVRLMDHDIPCIPVHDSFIVGRDQGDTLNQVMLEEAWSVVGFHPRVDRKY